MNTFMSFVPLLLLSAVLGVSAHLLAKDKGRNVVLWTVLGVIPIVNMVCAWYFVGASNLRLERKIDKLLEALEKGEIPVKPGSTEG